MKTKEYIAITIGLIIMLGLHQFYIWGSSRLPVEEAYQSIYILSAYTSIVTYLLNTKTKLIDALKINLKYTLTVSIFTTVAYGVEITTFVQINLYPYWDWQRDWPKFLLIILKTSFYSSCLAISLTLFIHIIEFFNKKTARGV